MHDINALISLCSDHKEKFGDSIHHALADHVLELREKIKTSCGIDAIVADKIKKCSSDDSAPSHAEGVGKVLSSACRYDGYEVLRSCYYALVDSNFHAEAARLKSEFQLIV